MKRGLLSSIICFISLSYAPFSVAQTVNPDQSIPLKAGRLSLAPNAKAWLDSAVAKPSGLEQVFIQFNTLPSDQQRHALRNLNIDLADPLPAGAFIALVRLPVKPVDADAFGIRSIMAVPGAWKLSSKLQGLNFQAGNTTTIFVRFDRKISRLEIGELLKEVKGSIKDDRFGRHNAFEITIPQNKIPALAAMALVKYVDFSAEDQPLNEDSRAASYGALLQSPVSVGGYGLDGSGITIGVGDNSGALFHIDTRDRTINFNTEPPAEHGSHVTGTAAGAGIIDPKVRGFAPAAGILSHLYNIVLAQAHNMKNDYGMTLTNNSYASTIGDCAYAGTYDSYSQELDEMAFEDKDIEHVFASANDGLLTCAPYSLGYATVTGSYQPAKNVLTVGASMKNEIIWHKSSRGPVKDGRLKPEIVAFGATTYSVNVFDQHSLINGTSMACPVATGALALLSQRYKQLNGGANPPGSLLKILAMNGATDYGNPGPDYIYGFGLLNLDHSIRMLQNSQYHISSLSPSASQTINITVPPNTAQLKVMLYWHDPAASPLAAAALVNNLDLEVTSSTSVVHRPKILNPAPANVSDNAVEGIDNLNNVEQVTIDNPALGLYTATVTGTSLPAGTQDFIVAYDFITRGVQLSYPTAGVPIQGNDTVKIYWEASDDPNTYKLEYSTNNGSSWNLIVDNIPASQKYYRWDVPNVSTAEGKIRLSRNNTGGQQFVSGTFTINPQPVLSLDAVQCSGYIAVSWNSISNATGYEVLRKKGIDIQPIDTVTGTSYILSGLSTDSTYYVVVRPLINGARGYRSLAVKRQPNDGNCSFAASNGDLMASAVITPSTGRVGTSTELTSAETLKLKVRNLDDASNSNYKISYNINGGAWQTQSFTTTIPGNDVLNVSVSGLNLAAPGSYTLRAAVTNLAASDPVRSNDTITVTIRQLVNDPVSLGNLFSDGFEAGARLTLMYDSMGFTANEHWDYSNSADSGRLRNFVSDDVLISGDRSISMDMLYNMQPIQNHLTGTFNLDAYNAATTEGRVEFDYKIHGQPKFQDGNQVWIRGSDTQPWLLLYNIDTTITEGTIKNTGSLSATNALLAAGQDYTSSFQVRIGQNDTSVIALNDYGNGLTVDNFKIYSVKNDVQLLSILSPGVSECGLDTAVPLVVQVYNSDNLPQNNVDLFYRFDNGPVFSQTLPHIDPKDTVQFSFDQKLDVGSIGYHTLDVWLVATGDTYTPNDSLLNYRFRNQPLIETFPYLEDFEAGSSNWYEEGQNSSWAWGAISSPKINMAASGTKGWKTNLSGNYKDDETAYLYSPCFDIAGMNDPMLSFSMAMDIESCPDQLCDAAYVEYSYDGVSWTKLGAAGEGTNWYNDEGAQVWHKQDDLRWHVASIPLPASTEPIKIRFVFNSDPGTSREGIAIDDIHVFDRVYPVYNSGSITKSETVNAGPFTDFISAGKIMSQLQAGNSLGNTDVSVYLHGNALNPISRQYVLPRNFVINSSQQPSTDVTTRLYVLDEEVLTMVNDISCASCPKAPDAYRLGIIKYDDADKAHENGSFADNTGGDYSFIPYTDIRWVPYDKGYYAETKLGGFSELWFGVGVPDKIFSGVTIYPNPVTDGSLNIIWSAEPGSSIEAVMTDVLGKVVYKSSAVAGDYDNSITLRLPDLETGIYIIRVITAGTTTEAKVLVN
jgi:hypothetical protein